MTVLPNVCLVVDDLGATGVAGGIERIILSLEQSEFFLHTIQES